MLQTSILCVGNIAHLAIAAHHYSLIIKLHQRHSRSDNAKQYATCCHIRVCADDIWLEFDTFQSGVD